MVRRQNGPTGIRSLKTRVGRECSISGQGARLYSGGIHVGRVRGESHSVTSGNKAGGIKRRRIRRQTGKRRAEESENRRPIFRKLCAALLRLFRRQHSEKIKGSARGN